VSAARPALVTLLPTYRRPALLARAMRSVLAQDFADFELRIYDNHSGDDTADVVRRVADGDPRVRYHCHDHNIGARDNFEYAASRVDAPYFTFLSDDVYLLPGFFRQAMAGFAAHPQAQFWAGLTLNVDESGTIWDARVLRWPREGLYVPPDGLLRITGGMSPTWTSIVFRREVLDSVGLPDRDTLGPMDLDFVLKIAARHPFVLSKAPTAVFTLNTASFSATQPLSSFWPGWRKMLRNFEQLPGLDPAVRSQLLARLHADARSMLLRRGANALAQGRGDFALDAAAALAADYSAHARATLLRTLAWACAHVPGVQRLFGAAYRRAERRIVASRAPLQAQFGHLLQPVDSGA
jgi:glycosyltransferase involved in cell wall biosynthesis